MKKVVTTLLTFVTVGAMMLSAAAESEGGKDTLTVGVSQLGEMDPMSWTNTHQYWFDGLVFDRLVSLDAKTLEVKPQLAIDWEYSEDGTEMVFDIHTDAVFHNGEKVTAADVAYSINTAIASPYLASYLTTLTGAEAVDEDTVKVSMTEYSNLALPAMGYVFIVPEALYSDESSNFSENLVGSGPFKVDNIDSVMKTYTVTRNEEYWGEAPALREITFREISDISTMTVALEKGEIDMSNVYPSSYNVIAENENLETASSAQNTFAYLTMNTELAPFDNALVRQAINYALDRESIMLVATGGVDAVADSVMNADTWGIDASSAVAYEYDPEKAKALLEEAGVTLPLDLGTMSIIPSAKDAAEMVQQNLAEIGINIGIEQTEIANWMGNLISGNYLLGIMGSYDMTYSALQEIAPSSSIDNMNFARFSDEELDASVAGFYSAKDEEEKAQNGTRAIEILQEKAPYAVLYKAGTTLGYQKGLHIDYMNPLYTDLSACYWE